ncbi:RHS repeat-associated core domain-containing protein [Pseudomonas putida]|uniref:RHS repeat-associated core domain-containing protein n=1 Tax=Pseudomonas putida TaxID=303 RepID=UPI0034DA67E6
MAYDNTDNPKERQCHSLHALSYAPYGYRSGHVRLLGFNGERTDRVTGHYLLGNGYRGFNPVVMRFNSPDSVSPFGMGGLNAYCYCMGDPINHVDTDGHSPISATLTTFNFNKYRRTVMEAYETTGVSAARYSSSPSLAIRPPKGYAPIDWDMVGYHVSAIEHGPSLKSGLDPKFIGLNHYSDFGPGFYVTPQTYLTTIRGRQILAEGKTPGLYGVYVENMGRLKQGRDFIFGQHPEYANHRQEMEIVIRPSAYHLIAVRSLRQDQSQVVLPRSKEAPF